MADVERDIIDRLAEEDAIPVSDIDTETVQPLIDTTYVVNDEKEGVYCINGSFFKKVVLEHAR